MPGKPNIERFKEEIENTDQLTLTDRLNKYLLCAYLKRLNEEDHHSDESVSNALERSTIENFDTEERFSD